MAAAMGARLAVQEAGGNFIVDPMVGGNTFGIVAHYVLGSTPTWFVQFYEDLSNPSLVIEKTIATSDMAGVSTIIEIWFGNSFLGVPLACELSEALIYDIDLTEDEGTAVINFFKNKWG